MAEVVFAVLMDGGAKTDIVARENGLMFVVPRDDRVYRKISW